jgi:hypothetical protein
MTMLGMAAIAALLGFMVFAALRLTPVYLNYMKVVSVIDGVREEFDGQNAARTEIRRSIGRRVDVESVSVVTARDITVKPVDGGMEVSAIYDHTAPFIANISFSVHFDKTVVIRR